MKNEQHMNLSQKHAKLFEMQITIDDDHKKRRIL